MEMNDKVNLLINVLAEMMSTKKQEKFVTHERNLLDTNDVKSMFRISDRTLRRWRNKKLLKSVIIVGCLYYRREDVMSLMVSKFRDEIK